MVKKNNCGKKKCPLVSGKTTMDYEYGDGKGCELYHENGTYIVKYFNGVKHSETPYEDRSIAWSRYLDVKDELFPSKK